MFLSEDLELIHYATMHTRVEASFRLEMILLKAGFSP
jgi:hypothetical protein